MHVLNVVGFLCVQSCMYCMCLVRCHMSFSAVQAVVALTRPGINNAQTLKVTLS